MQHSGVFLLVITITLLGYTSAVESQQGPNPSGASQSNGSPVPPATNSTQKCSERSPQYKAASEKLKKTFLDIINNAIHGNQQNVNETLNSPTTEYFEAAKTCGTNVTLLTTYRTEAIFGVMNFVVSNVTILKELDENEQFKCMAKEKEGLLKCVETVKDPKTKNTSIMELYNQDFNELTCARSKTTQDCVVSLLKNKCNKSVEFVNGIFNNVQQYCVQKETPKSGSVRISASWVGFVIFIVEFTKRAVL